MADTSSRRRFERVPVKVKLLVTVGTDVFEKNISIECRDISDGGLSFETGTEVPVEANTRIVLGRLGNLPPDARIEARVAYRDKDATTGRYTVGVEFLDVVNITREELIARIHGWQASG